jgi:hypothetical protein
VDGTYQALLTLRELYARGAKPRVVIYGLLPFHSDRNVAHTTWLRTLARYSAGGHAALPFCSLHASGALQEHKPVEYPSFLFREQLALADVAAKFYFKFIDAQERKRRRDAPEITCKLMSAMDRLARRNGSAFYVAMLGHLRDVGPSRRSMSRFAGHLG